MNTEIWTIATGIISATFAMLLDLTVIAKDVTDYPTNYFLYLTI